MTTPPETVNPVADLADLLNQLDGNSPAEPVADQHEPAEPPAPEPAFRNVEAFVGGYLTYVVERKISSGAVSGLNWCPRWWAHPEALSRLYALWRAWETLRVADPQTGMSIWWRDHLDPHLNSLTSENGPFARCDPAKHVDAKPLPVEPAPAEVLAQLPDN